MGQDQRANDVTRGGLEAFREMTSWPPIVIRER